MECPASEVLLASEKWHQTLAKAGIEAAVDDRVDGRVGVGNKVSQKFYVGEPLG